MARDNPPSNPHGSTSHNESLAMRLANAARLDRPYRRSAYDRWKAAAPPFQEHMTACPVSYDPEAECICGDEDYEPNWESL